MKDMKHNRFPKKTIFTLLVIAFAALGLFAAFGGDYSATAQETEGTLTATTMLEATVEVTPEVTAMPEATPEVTSEPTINIENLEHLDNEYTRFEVTVNYDNGNHSFIYARELRNIAMMLPTGADGADEEAHLVEIVYPQPMRETGYRGHLVRLDRGEVTLEVYDRENDETYTISALSDWPAQLDWLCSNLIETPSTHESCGSYYVEFANENGREDEDKAAIQVNWTAEGDNYYVRVYYASHVARIDTDTMRIVLTDGSVHEIDLITNVKLVIIDPSAETGDTTTLTDENDWTLPDWVISAE